MTATANAAGGLVARVEVPSFDWFGLRPWEALALPVTATDTALAANPALGPTDFTATATATYTDWGVRVPAWQVRTKGHPRRMMTVTAIGWHSEGKVMYAHYTRGGKLVKTIRIGALTGPCGNVTRHMRQFPFRPVAAGLWRVQFDTSRDFKVPGEWYTVYRSIRVAAAEAIH